MAARNFTQFSYGLEKMPVLLYATIDFNDASAPALKSWSCPAAGGAGSYATTTSAYKGVTSVTRTAQGKYTIVLTDTYVRLLGMDYTFKAIDGLTSPKALTLFVMTEAVATNGTRTVVVGASNTANSTTLVDLGANDRVLFTFALSNSTAQ